MNRIAAEWSTREARIDWIAAMDRHACITDDDMRSEFGRIATSVETWQVIGEILDLSSEGLLIEAEGRARAAANRAALASGAISLAPRFVQSRPIEHL